MSTGASSDDSCRKCGRDESTSTDDMYKSESLEKTRDERLTVDGFGKEDGRQLACLKDARRSRRGSRGGLFRHPVFDRVFT